MVLQDRLPVSQVRGISSINAGIEPLVVIGWLSVGTVIPAGFNPLSCIEKNYRFLRNARTLPSRARGLLNWSYLDFELKQSLGV